jgi:site-specific DNA recombinase
MTEKAQERLARNKELSRRNSKRNYLLSGHLRCRRCGNVYVGLVKKRKDIWEKFYRCRGRLRDISLTPCKNKGYKADNLESVIWQQTESLLSQPELVLFELQRRQQNLEGGGFLERDLETVKEQLANREKQKERIHRAFYVTGDEEIFRRDIAMVTEEINALLQEKSNLEKKIEASKEFHMDVEGIKRACELVRQNLRSISFEEKRFILEMLQVRAWIDGSNITLEGVIPICEGSIESFSSHQ